MIALISGIVTTKHKNVVVITTGDGIGYEISVSSIFFTLLTCTERVTLFTYLKVSENAMELFGFKTLEEKHFFEQLISVNGVGPRTAMNILGLGSLEHIQSAVGRGDVSYLTSVSGIGKKTAERLCVELKGKVAYEMGNGGQEVEGDKLAEVVEALVGMGYTKEDARVAIKGLDVDKPVEDVLRDALKRMK